MRRRRKTKRKKRKMRKKRSKISHPPRVLPGATHDQPN